MLCHLGSLFPAVGEQVLASAPRSRVWGPEKGLCLASGHFLSQADIDQLKRIMEVVGTPSPEVLAKISSEHVSHQPPASSADQAPGALEGGQCEIGPGTMWGARATVEQGPGQVPGPFRGKRVNGEDILAMSNSENKITALTTVPWPRTEGQHQVGACWSE